MSWYQEAEAELGAVAAAVQSQRRVDLRRLERLAADLTLALKQSDELVVEALAGPSGSPLITNLINVAIVGTKVGVGLGYYGQELERLALAGLVHDIGLFAVPQSIVTKKGRLTQDERLLIEQHPELGYQVVRKAGAEYEWLAHLVRQAHERSNGQGYPGKLRGRQISEMAQILGLVDVFDALVSERPYRPRLLPHEAVRELVVSERSTFPREILKALVEQLSVYPLGTTVRLTTGEVGTVVRVNSRYPLRPVIRITEGDTEDGRLLDLSLTPLVSVIAILNPPVVGRVTFPAPAVQPEAAGPPAGMVSDHFTSLLESLDAIATAIQGVVENRIAVRPPSPSASDAGAGATDAASARPDQPFRTEIIGLFALEAKEWLAQIKTALKKLAAEPEGPARAKLYSFLLSGVTNLAKSASTVQSQDIETMAANLLPLLRQLGGADMTTLASALRTFESGVDRIGAAVRRLAGEEPHTDASPERAVPPDPIRCEEPSAGTPHAASPEGVQPAMRLLPALRELQQARARSTQPARDVLEVVIQLAEQGQEREEEVGVETIERILRELDALDEAFLQDVRTRVPGMMSILSRLRSQEPTTFVTASELDPILADLDVLQRRAKEVQAVTIMMFVEGVKSFLTVSAYRKVASLPQRLEALEERLNALVPMAEQWVSLGRLERSAIEEILPA